MNPITAAHRKVLLSLRARTVKDLARLWSALDLRRLERTWPVLEAALVSVIERRGKQAADLGAAYYEAHRKALAIPGTPTPAVAEASLDQIVNGLRFNGPVNAGQQLASGREIEDVTETTLTRLTGASTNYVNNFSRESIFASLRADDQAVMWQRVSGGGACAFCAMLVSRGPVYVEESAQFDSHRACMCSAEPVYTTRGTLSPQAQSYRDIWNEATEGLHYTESLNAFRKALN